MACHLFCTKPLERFWEATHHTWTYNMKKKQTRTTRTPAFWGYPATSWLPILLSHIGSQIKRRQSQSYKFKEFAKILKQLLHATHLLKLLDKMWKYEMDPMSIVDDTELTRFCPQTDKMKPVYPPFNFVEAGGIITEVVIYSPLYHVLIVIKQCKFNFVYMYIWWAVVVTFTGITALFLTIQTAM